MKTIEAEGSTNFQDFARRAIASAKRTKGRRFAVFNRVVLWVKPDDNVNAVSERYHVALKRCDEFLKSQQRKKRRRGEIMPTRGSSWRCAKCYYLQIFFPIMRVYPKESETSVD